MYRMSKFQGLSLNTTSVRRGVEQYKDENQLHERHRLRP